MIIAILKDKKSSSVCLTPEAVSVLVQNNHTVLIAGEARDKLLTPYLNVGGYLIDTKEELLDRGDLLVKKTEPELEEVEYVSGEAKIFFTTVDFRKRKLIEKVLAHKISLIDYMFLQGIAGGEVAAGNTIAFSNYTLPFLLGLAHKGLRVLVDDELLREALIMMNGKVYNSDLASRYNYHCYEF